MKPFYLFFIAILCYSSIKSQTVIVSGECMIGDITLEPIDAVDGKPAYEGTGDIGIYTGVIVDVYWMPAPDNVWVLAFSGQPYFQNTCDTTLPWSTGNAACPWTLVSGQTCSGGTPLAMRGAGTLSVNLISFTARIENKQVIVNWKTANETNNKGFYVQRSADGTNWTNIGFVNGNINSSTERSYQFNDLKPAGGKNLYRLRQVDLDGRYAYSKVATVNFVKSGLYSISNNPGSGLFRLHVEADAAPGFNFSVIDAGGRRIMSKINSGPGDQMINLSNHPSGVYLLRIQNGTSLFTERLIKL